MKNSRIEINDEIINCYKELEKIKNEMIALAKLTSSKEENSVKSIYSNTRKAFEEKCSELGFKVIDGIDMVLRYIYTTNRNSMKGFLFDIFGDIIFANLQENIKEPLGEYIMCEICGERVKLNGVNDGSTKYCNRCAKEIKLKRDREIQRVRYINSRKGLHN